MTNTIPPACRLQPPASELVAVIGGIAPGKALDLAAGMGRHSRWLAAKGWEVTAVDIAIPEVPAEGVTWVQADLEKTWVAFHGDLTVCWLYWQADLLPMVAESVRPGGVVALAGKTSGRFATSLSAYRQAFSGWRELATGEDGIKAWFIAARPA